MSRLLSKKDYQIEQLSPDAIGEERHGQIQI